MVTWDRDTEQTVLAGIVQEPLARKLAVKHVSGADFYEPAHEAIWEAVARMDRQGLAVSPTTVAGIVRANRRAVEVITDIVTRFPTLHEVETCASQVRADAVKRRIAHEARLVVAEAENPASDAAGLAAGVVNRFTRIRDTGVGEDLTAITLGELLDEPEEPYDWLIPHMLERGERLVLTGHEGGGKSVMMRQLAICLAAGLHPFGGGRVGPARVMIIDAENSRRQIRRGFRSLAIAIDGRGQIDPRENILIEAPGRIDILADRDLTRIHQALDAFLPDVLVIGPLYRLIPRAIQTDDEAAPLLAALDTIKDRGIALLIEAHAGHAHKAGGSRDMRPRGSSALLGWPEFGYGLAPDPHVDGEFVLDRWRGDRDQRYWPTRLRRGGALPWTDISPVEEVA